MPDMLLKAQSCPALQMRTRRRGKLDPGLGAAGTGLQSRPFPLPGLLFLRRQPHPLQWPSLTVHQGFPIRDSCIALDPSRQRSPVHPPGHSGVE